MLPRGRPRSCMKCNQLSMTCTAPRPYTDHTFPILRTMTSGLLSIALAWVEPPDHKTLEVARGGALGPCVRVTRTQGAKWHLWLDGKQCLGYPNPQNMWLGDPRHVGQGSLHWAGESHPEGDIGHGLGFDGDHGGGTVPTPNHGTGGAPTA